MFALSSGLTAPEFAFQTKSFASVVDKTYRLNYNWNRNFPREPSTGWVRSTNWFSSLDDLVRTRLVCRYLGFATEMFTVLYAIARTAGWIAHWKEMIDDPSQRIGRPRQLYTGATERTYVPMEARS